MLLVFNAKAAIFYVDLNSPAPTSPYGSWSTAAANIQDAIDAAADGDSILVTNGVYQTGGRTVYGALTNRVVINKAVTVQSVNGPAATSILGNPVNDDTAVRCVYLTNHAALIGFTLTKGATRSSGDPARELSGGGAWCESTSAMISNCVVTANAAASQGGGDYGGTLNGCIISSNTVTLWWNSGGGGGVEAGVLNNCLLYGNASSSPGGGTSDSIVNNCTIVNNASSSYDGGGGSSGSKLNNCIIYYNGDNFAGCAVTNCCTTPDPATEEENDGTNYDNDMGTNNVLTEPRFVDYDGGDFRLQSNSPCIDAGNNATAPAGTDLAGNPRIISATVDIGAYEFRTEQFSATLRADHTNVAAGFYVHFRGWFDAVQSESTVSVLDFGDGTEVSNQLAAGHSWAAPGDYAVVLHAYDAANPGGASATQMVHVAEGSYYVALGNPGPVFPYTTWNTAATNIQDAVEAAPIGGVIWVSNGVYQAGSRTVDGITTNRVTMSVPMTVRSVNGANATMIDGGGRFRCVYLTNGAVLAGFTLTNGYTPDNGGGAIGGTLNHCVITRNASAPAWPHGGGGAYASELNYCTLTGNTAFYGGGAYASTLNNCVVAGNSAGYGGGTCAGTLNNSTVTGNSAGYGGGANSSMLNNCIVYFNSAAEAPNSYGGALNYCCTTPDPGGTGNIPYDPLFADLAHGDLHLQSNSPCINEGNNDGVAATTDFDGSPRIQDGTVDVGAYEFQTPVPLQAVIHPESTNVICGFPLNLAGSTLGGPGTSNAWTFGDGGSATNQWTVTHTWAATGNYPVTFTAFNGANPGGVSTTLTIDVVTQILYYVDAQGTNPVMPFATPTTAATNLQSAVDKAMAGGTVVVNDGVYAPFGVGKPLNIHSVHGSAATTVDGGGGQRCVSLDSGASLAGFTITNGADYVGAGVYCASTAEVVSNCVLAGNAASDSAGGAYQGTFNNCVFAGNTATYLYAPDWGYNGRGGGAYQSVLNDCVLTGNSGYQGGAANSSTLNRCLVNNNGAPYSNLSGGGYGGGVWSGTASNCIFSGNNGNYGGGACYASLANSVVQGNAAAIGGGEYASTLVNCTVVGNAAYGYYGGVGGGALGGNLTNCIIYYNSAVWDDGNCDGSTLDHCCTTSVTPGPGNNIANEPRFVDYANGNLQLQSNSPCINSGYNPAAMLSTDLGGNPRIQGGTVDLGAYEYQNPSSILGYAWAQQYGLPTDGSADHADTDHDGMDNRQEWMAGTNPTNAVSVLKMLTPVSTNRAAGIIVSWQSVNTVSYYLQRSSNLSTQPAFATIQSDLAGQSGTTSYADTNAAGGGPFFYRVGVQ